MDFEEAALSGFLGFEIESNDGELASRLQIGVVPAPADLLIGFAKIKMNSAVD